jgi:hypothetical protein
MAARNDEVSYTNDQPPSYNNQPGQTPVGTSDKVSYSNDEGAAEKAIKSSDSSSGNAENLENGGYAELFVVDKAVEKAVLRKLDYRIVPMIMWVYLMNMMDRGEHHFSDVAAKTTTDQGDAQSILVTPASSTWRRT